MNLPLLRQWQESDFEPFSAMNADEEVMRYFLARQSREESRKMFERLRAGIEQHGWGVWAVEVDGAFAGMVGLNIPKWKLPFSPCTEILWRLRREFWGRGIAYAAAKQAIDCAFTRVGLQEIVAFTTPPNHRSIRLMGRLGLERDLHGDFNHPAVPEGHPLRRHILFRMKRSRTMTLSEHGCETIRTSIAAKSLAQLRDGIFKADEAGTRCLLDEPLVRQVAGELRAELVAADILPASAVAIQAIAFDKTPGANWKVTWHQDVMFPFARPVSQAGFELPCVKAGVDYARPPRDVLEDLLAVRLHLDECDESNGPLRVAPGSHREGVFRSAEISQRVAQYGENVSLARAGEALLMKPLLLHASSPATNPKHRRVLHIVFHAGRAIPETWHRAI